MSAALALPVRAPAWVLTYQGVAITADITAMVEEITYDNHEQHKSDEIQLKLEDRDYRWQGPWSPSFGDLVTLQIGYAGEPLLACGSFQVDEIELELPPDVFHLKALAAGPKPGIRTPTSARYESQTLAQIAQTVAASNGFTVVNAPSSTGIALQRVTQNRETDLQFLRRLANAYNYDFSIRGTQLVFYARGALETAAPILAINRTDVIRANFKGKTGRTYNAARVSYQNPATKTLVTATVSDPTNKTGDILDIAERAENVNDAQAKAAAALHLHNMHQSTCEMTLPGNVKLVAGVVVTAGAGFGGFAGNYLITKSRHRLERSSAYTTEIDGRAV